mgnify:CR=1 FL=1
MSPLERSGAVRHWHFLTNHSHVLVCLMSNPEARIRDVASAVGITERAAVRIVNELEDAGFVVRHRAGRRNWYEFTLERPLRHPLEAACSVSDLLEPILNARARTRTGRAGGRHNGR